MRILFTALNSLADPASGAAISVRTILKMLGARGHEVVAMTAACFDQAPFETEAQMLRWTKFSEKDDQTWELQDGPLRHVVVLAGDHRVAALTKDQIQSVTNRVSGLASAFAPDLVISFGGTSFEKDMRRMLKSKGAKIAFYLANPMYRDISAFDLADIILTDSRATQALYQDRLGLGSEMIGKFIARPEITRSDGPGFITFVNPTYEKGVTLFYRIVEMMREMLPVARFMVVESRASLQRIEAETGLPFSDLRSIRRIGLQADMGDIFARTRILLMPSVWHESGGRTAIEAMSLGLPVVASNHGGLAEHLGTGAILLGVPDPLRKNPKLIPPRSAALPWAIALSELWSDAEYRAERATAALEQWAQHDPSDRTDHLETLLEKVISA